jgi:hypothetical protein
MRWSKWFVLATVLSGICCVAQTSPDAATQKPTSTDPGFTITVAPPASPIRVGSPIKVTITVKNVTNSDIYWNSDRGPDTVYNAFRLLLRKDGREVETTFFHRKITGRNRPGDPNEVGSGSSILLPHPPGTMFVMTIDLKRLYEITEPGEYTLDVSRIEDGNKTTVHANIVTLKIVP